VEQQKLDALVKAWQARYGYASCEGVLDRFVLLHHDLTSVSREVQSEKEHRIVHAMVRFLVRIEPATDAVTIELKLGREPLASHELSEARAHVDAETIYSYFLFERLELNDHSGIRQKFIETCRFFLETLRKE
jgi:hypothetical protein